MDTLPTWLRGLGLERYAAVFADNGVDLNSLHLLTDGDLEKLGVLLGHRRMLFEAIDILRGTGKIASPRSPDSYTPKHLAERILTSRSALEGERKLVTVLFCDIANSTQLAARVGADEMHVLLNRFFELALAEVHRFEGTINQFLGDGFMALFGAPLAHEDHARRALLAALGIQQRLRDASAEEATLREVRVRMGVNTGMVVVGKIGDNLRMDYTAVGDTTNLAARLQQQAEPGAIRTSEATHRAALSYFEFKPLGKHPLKGIAKPVKVYDLLKVRSAGESGSRTEATGISSPLVGRDRELSVLTASIEILHQGRGGIVILQGEPGVGKSRLIAEARRRSGYEGVLWLEGRSLSFGRTLSYWPFMEILKQCFGIDDNDAEAQAWRKLEQGCEELFGARADEIVPYLATLLALEMIGEHEQRVKYLDPQALGRQVFLSMRQLFEQLAKRQPVLLLMEDWHWVDQSSVALCEHLLPLAGSVGLLFWFAARADPGEPTARIRAAAGAEPAWSVQEIALSPLAEDQSNLLLDHLVGTDHLPAALRSQILRKTEGNPFFVEEVIRALIADGALVKDAHGSGWRLTKPVEALALPDTIQGVIVARIDRLEEGVKGVLKLASVIGRSFFLRILQAVSEAGNKLETGLAQLEQTELIRLRQQVPELEYIFKHALVQEAAYGSIVAERRRAIHRSVAQTIEALFADRLDEFTSLLAYHYARAEDWERAQVYLFKAGDQAGGMAADAEALDHYRQALAAYTKVFGDRWDAVQRAAIDRKIGEALFRRGEHERALEYLTSALAQLGSRYPKSRGAVRRAIIAQIIRQLGHRFLPRLFLRDLTGTAEAAALEKAGIYQVMGWIHYFFDSEQLVLDTFLYLNCSEAAGLGEDEKAIAISSVAVVFDLVGAFGIAWRYQSRADRLIIGTGNLIAQGLCEFFGAWYELYQGRWNGAVARLERAASTFREAGHLRYWGGAIATLSVVQSSKGDTGELLRLAQELLQAGRDTADRQLSAFGANVLALGCRRGGASTEAIEWNRKAIELYEAIPDHLGVVYASSELAGCHLEQDNLEGALAVLDKSNALLQRIGARGHQVTTSRLVTAGAYLALAERSKGAEQAKALKLARQACAAAHKQSRHVRDEGVPQTLRLQGIYQWLVGNRAAAERLWERSIAEAQRLGARYALRSTYLERGARLGRQSDLDAASAISDELRVNVSGIANPSGGTTKAHSVDV